MAKKVDGVILPVTFGELISSFGFTCLFGLAGIPLIFELKDLVPLVLLKILPLKSADRAYTIATVMVVAIFWLAMFFVLWHKLEQKETNGQRALTTLKWVGITLGAIAVVIGFRILFTNWVVPGF